MYPIVKARKYTLLQLKMKCLYFSLDQESSGGQTCCTVTAIYFGDSQNVRTIVYIEYIEYLYII